RLGRMAWSGSTTIEVKSGYGLDPESERTLLEVAAVLDRAQPYTVVTTFLGAHVVPVEYRDRRDEYVELVCGPMMEACAPLAEFCDVFCDEAAFTVEEARRILEAGRAHGLKPKLHADQLGRVGAARLAAEVGAVSADHVDHASDADLAALAEAGTVAVLLPGASFSMRLPFPDGRRVWDAGVTVALATDCNPGTSWVERMGFVVALAVLELGLTPAEALWAATRGGALALDRPDRGRLTPGDRGDLVVLDAPSHLHLAYRPDRDLTAVVVVAGEVLGRR
ncbi:MAG TPA: imidazolonepropionase, partial [Actinobacteria bacterium]|nr:imidazolonepropionase [Actinomycetota bacterium]